MGRDAQVRLTSAKQIKGYSGYIVQWVNGGLSSEYWVYVAPPDIAEQLIEKGAKSEGFEQRDR